MMHNLSLVQLGQMIGAAELTPFAVVFRLLQLLSTGVLMVSMPLWPAITDATVRGDREWIVSAYSRLLLSAMGFCTLTAIVVGLLGPSLIPLWAGDGVRPDVMLCAALGLYFIVWMWNHCHSTILFGLGRLWVVAWVMLAEGALVLIVSALLVPSLGALGTAVALCLAGLSTSGWILPWMVRHSLKRPLHVHEADLPAAPPEEPIA
jgi:O-antigen/teichoic acid export membrane protein